MFKRLWRYIRGVVEVQCDGGFFHRFLNRAMEQGLHIFKIKMNRGTARFHVFISDYKALRPIAKKSQCRIRVRRKRGLYFGWRRLPNKAALIAGLLVFCTVIAMMGKMVFVIEITGNSLISKEVLMASLERNGLRVGMMAGDVDVTAVGHGVMLENERLAWVAVNISFGLATVEVKDKDAESDIPLNSGPLVASRDAQVKSITTISGNVLVQPGEVVRQGQTLVEPLPDLGDSWAAEANAVVMAYTEHTTVFTLERNHVYRLPTGHRTVIRSLNFGETNLPLSLQKNPYRYFDIIRYEQPVWIFHVEMPWRIAVTEYIEVEQFSVELNRTQAQALCNEHLVGYEQTELSGCEILNREINVEEKGARFIFTIHYLCLENIAIYG